jgi:hypothetical protein
LQREKETIYDMDRTIYDVFISYSRERQSEGWTLGPKRDDAKLETPDMVPYADLADSERQYDRVMAEDTLKLFMALGYKIVKA